jgi:dolichyl-phosphate-mannose-protein mannosyltransferase
MVGMIKAKAAEFIADIRPGTDGRLTRLLNQLQATDWIPLLLVILVFAALDLRLLWLDQPSDGLIFDEAYYVNAARIILGWPVAPDTPYADGLPGFDPNIEHPPLAKLLIAASMRLFGDNAFGWRLASVIFGTISVPLLYGIVRQVGAAKPVALLATFLYAFDNLVLVHSRIATLDIFLVSFLLLGLYCYLMGRPILAAFGFVAATLCKITGAFGIAALVGFEGMRLARQWAEAKPLEWKSLKPLLIMIAIYGVALPALLALLDSVWSSAFKNPFDHFRHILDYGLTLTRPEGPQAQESNPWQWLVNEVPMTYFRADENVMVNDELQTSRPTIFFRGAMNPYLIFMAPMALAYAGYMALKQRDDCSFLVVSLFVACFGPFWAAALFAHRISYLFYFLPTIPALAIGVSHFMYAPQTLRVVRWTYIGAVLLGFYAYFPFVKAP